MNHPVYVFSDSHMGAGYAGAVGPAAARDNFGAWGHDRDLFDFLNFIDHDQSGGGSIVITGDLFEFWQAAVGDVLMARKDILDRLAAFGRGDLNRLRYIPGNHDIDLRALIPQAPKQVSDWLRHPFFNHMAEPFTEKIGDRYYRFLHGHEGDEFNQSSFPGSGRILAIMAAVVEDMVGSPYFDKTMKVSVEGSLSALADKVLGFWQWLTKGIIQRKNSDQRNGRGDQLRGMGYSGETAGIGSDLLTKEVSFFEALEQSIHNGVEGVSGEKQDGGWPSSSDDDFDRLTMDYLRSAWEEYIIQKLNQSELRSVQAKGYKKRGSRAMVRDNIGQIAKIRDQLDHRPIMICGHTHVSGRHEDWYFNSGSWIDQYGEIIRITPSAGPELFHWRNRALESRPWPIL